MLLPIDWLKQFVTVDESTEDVARRFVELGFESEVIGKETINLEITPNRGDALSILGLAREYAASTNQEIRELELEDLTYETKPTDFSLLAEAGTYHRLAATIMKGVRVEESPAWLKEALESVGMNSINSVVDLTNYVMFELGIPIHAFDLDRLPAKELLIRLSKEGEQFTSLKDEAFALPADAIVVESGKEIIDLLGIRGGKSTIITPKTHNILVWAASVPRPLIRQAVKSTALRTEAAFRHERETDWQMVPVALRRLVKLIREVTGGHYTWAIDREAEPQEVKKIMVDSKRVNSVLGTKLNETDIVTSLQRLGFTHKNGYYHVPSWRYFDINFPEDLVEEVARIHGYNRIARKVITPSQQQPPSRYNAIELLKDALVAAGFTEVYTESFSGGEEADLFGWNESLLAKLANPVNRDFAYTRPSLIPNLLKLLAFNSWSDQAKIFEVGNVFPTRDQEITHVAIAAYGKQAQLFEKWASPDMIKVIAPDQPVAKRYKLRRPVIVAELPVEKLLTETKEPYTTPTVKPAYQAVSAFPPAVRDISLIIDTSVDLEKVKQTVKAIAPESIILVDLFDQFQSDKFGKGKQSLAFHIVYQSMDGTLTSHEVDRLHEQVMKKLEANFAATIR